MAQSRPSIYEYLDYRAYIRELIEYLKQERRFSMRSFAKRAGFSSPSYLKMVLDQKRNLTAQSIPQVSEGLRLSKSEAKFFEALVHFNQAVEAAQKDLAYQKLLSFRKFLQIQKTSSEQYEYFSHWFNVALREMLTSQKLQRDPGSWAKTLGVSQKQVDDALSLLSALGLAKKNEGVWSAQEVALETQPEMKSLVVRNFHRQMMTKGLESIDGVSQDERDLTSLTLAIPKSKMQEIKKRIAQFRRELNAVYSGSNEADTVYQINFQVFPLTKESK